MTISYQLDGFGQVSRVTGEFRGQEIVLANGITHMPFGPSESMTLGNGLAASRTYDLLYRLSTIQAGSVMDRSYTYYPNRNISQIQDLADPTRSQEFSYDHLDRLTSATGIYGTITYTYDNVGNRMSREENGVPETYSYISGTNKLLSIQGDETRDFVHDPVGNITQATTALSEPLSAGYEVGIYNYVYDGRNRRIKEIGVDTTTIYWYNSSGQMLGEWTVGEDFETKYVYLDDNLLAMVLVPIGEGSPRAFYCHTDHLGTPQKMTNSSASIAWSADYKPFGEVSITTNSQPNRIRFPGQYQDVETNLYYNYHRYYNSSTGRYLSPDPIGLLGGINGFTYAKNNPINFADPLGLFLTYNE